MTEEELTLEQLKEQKAQLEKELEQTKLDIRARDETISQRDERIKELEGGVAESEAMTSELEHLQQELAQAVEKYKAMVVWSNPDIPEELLRGSSLEEIDASVEQAKGLVDKVRKQIEEQVQATRIPAGAPPRAAPDLEAMSPGEKIKYALTIGR